MGVYIPLKVRLAKASIPQVVAYIQTYLEENPIPAIDTFAELIAEFLADHPELVAVASVNAKTGAVILTGADIMLNANADVTIDTEVTNLNTMIASLSSQVAQAVATVGGFETSIENINNDIDTINVALDTKDTEIYQINQTLKNHLNGINANNTKNAQQDTRLTALEADVSTLEAYNTATQGALSLHSEQIAALQGMIGDSSEILERLGEVEQTAENAQSAVRAMQTSVSTLQTSVQENTTDISTNTEDIAGLDTRVTALEGGGTSSYLKLYYQQYTLASVAAGSTSSITLTFTPSIQWSNVMVHAIAQNNSCFTNIVPTSNTQAGIAVRNVSAAAVNSVIVRVYVISADDIEFTLS